MSVKMLGMSPVSMLTTCSLQLLRFASRSLGDGRNMSSTSLEMMKMNIMRIMITLSPHSITFRQHILMSPTIHTQYMQHDKQ